MTERQHDALLGIATGRAMISSLIFFVVVMWPAGLPQALVYSVFAYVISFIWYRWRLLRQAAAIEKNQ